MIDYETFCKIHDCHHRQGLTVVQTARSLGLHRSTVATWLARARFTRRRSQPRPSKLDPFKPSIIRLLDTHPYSAQQIFQRLREEGYRGGISIVRDYVHRVRPPQRPVYLKLHFARGECAQVDWGAYGSIAIGNTRRRLSFFVMVLAFSRQMFVEFTVSQTMEHFLACHEHAFRAFGGVPARVMVDNLKSAVLQRLAGVAPVFNPRYLDFARHTRHYGRHQDIEDPDHAKGLLAQRRRASEQRLISRFLALSPDAAAYYDGLEQRRFNARHHVRKILALAEIYPADLVARAISDGLAFEAFSAEYIANILEARTRSLPEPGPLQLTRRHDLLDIDIDPPDLNDYKVNDHDTE